MSPHPSLPGVPGVPAGVPGVPSLMPTKGSPLPPTSLPCEGWADAAEPPTSSTCSAPFIPFIHPSNKQQDVYTLASWEPKQNGVFCTGGRYLWLVAKADNASSRDLLCVVQ